MLRPTPPSRPCHPLTLFTLFTLLLSLHLGLPLPLRAELVTIFQNDFSGSYEGTEPHHFNFVGSAENGEFALTSITDGRFQLVTHFSPDSVVNIAATRLSRHGGGTSAHALPFARQAAVLAFDFGFNPAAWTSDEINILSLSIGQRFRSGPYNPARSNQTAEGPAFATLSLQARPQEHRFRFIAGPGPGSSNFDIPRAADGFYRLHIVAAFNNGDAPLAFASPSGPHSVEPGRLSIWVNDALVWDNHHRTTFNREAEFQHFSIGLANGNLTDFADAQPWSGIYQLDNITVSTPTR